MKTFGLVASILLWGLVGCRTSNSSPSAKPTIPSYPALADAFDRSLRLAVYGADADVRNLLCSRLKDCKYPVELRSVDSLAGEIVPPDLVVVVRSCELNHYDYQQTGGCRFYCHLKVLVRPVMRTACGVGPKLPEGAEFDVWSLESVKQPTFKMANGQYVVENGALVWDVAGDDRQRLIGQACANLMNVKGFRRALERK